MFFFSHFKGLVETVEFYLHVKLKIFSENASIVLFFFFFYFKCCHK